MGVTIFSVCNFLFNIIKCQSEKEEKEKLDIMYTGGVIFIALIIIFEILRIMR